MSLNLSDQTTRGGTICLSKAGLAIGSTKTGVAIAAPNGAGVDFAIDGILYHKADAASTAVTAAQTVATLKTAIMLILLDSSGTLSTVMGTASTNAGITAGSEVIVWPTPTASTCCIGALKIKNASASTFTTGTDDFDATSITTTYIDLCLIPPQPLTS